MLLVCHNLHTSHVFITSCVHLLTVCELAREMNRSCHGCYLQPLSCRGQHDAFSMSLSETIGNPSDDGHCPSRAPLCCVCLSMLLCLLSNICTYLLRQMCKNATGQRSNSKLSISGVSPFFLLSFSGASRSYTP